MNKLFHLFGFHVMDVHAYNAREAELERLREQFAKNKAKAAARALTIAKAKAPVLTDKVGNDPEDTRTQPLPL